MAGNSAAQGANSPSGNSTGFDASFSTLVMSFAVQASVAMGLAPDPESGVAEKNKELARLNIDFLSIIETKTKGNLSNDEAQLLERLLTELRMRFVQTSW